VAVKDTNTLSFSTTQQGQIALRIHFNVSREEFWMVQKFIHGHDHYLASPGKSQNHFSHKSVHVVCSVQMFHYKQ
jgi:hypothetical protein